MDRRLLDFVLLLLSAPDDDDDEEAKKLASDDGARARFDDDDDDDDEFPTMMVVLDWSLSRKGRCVAGKIETIPHWSIDNDNDAMVVYISIRKMGRLNRPPID
jgi:hypothetical protein